MPEHTQAPLTPPLPEQAGGLDTIFGRLVEFACQGIGWASLDGSVAYMNPALRRLLELDAGEDVSCYNMRRFCRPEDLGRMEGDMLEATLREGRWSGEVALVSAKGQLVPTLHNIHLIRDAAGAPLAFACTITDLSQQKVQEQLLCDSRAKYQALVENIPQRVFYKDLQSRYVAVNLNYAKDLGVSPRDIIGRDDYALHPRELAEKYRQDDRRVMETGQAEEYDEGYVHDGRDCSIHIVKTPVRDKQGQVIGVCGIFRDVTEQRRLEERLKASEATLRAIYESAQEGILVVSVATGRFVMANPAMCCMLGYGEDELLSMTPQQLHPPEVLPRLREIFQAMERGEFGQQQELPFQRKDGTVLHADVSSTPLDINGKPCFLGVFRDVTDRRQAREALASSEALLAEAQSLAHLGNWNLDLVTGQASWSTEEYRLLGYEPGAVTPSGELFMQAVYPEDRAAVMAEMQRAMTPGETHPYRIEHRIARPDGVRIVAQQGRVVFDAAGRPLRMYGTTLDITEHKRLNEELEARVAQRTEELLVAKEEAERANRSKSEFLSRMSHELRTPLNAILGFGQLLEDDPAHPLHESQKEYVQEILHGGRHLLDLINDVLDLARVEAGRMSVSMAPVNLKALLLECLALVSPMAEQHGIRLLDETAASGSVLADRTRLKQVLLNLLSNAVKYNRKEGSVTVACTRQGDRVRIDVRDTGAGLTIEQQGRLFQSFERLGADGSAIEGTGIGLSLSKRLTELMQGEIGVESAPGKGSTFWLRFQATAAQALGSETAASTEQAPAASDGARILYIEDNPANLRLMERILGKREGVHLMTADRPGIGLELAMAQRPGLILLDINLPDMDGYQVLSRLKGREETRAIPVIGISANAMPKDVARARAAGFADYLTKPLEIPKLLGAIDNVLATCSHGEARS